MGPSRDELRRRSRERLAKRSTDPHRVERARLARELHLGLAMISPLGNAIRKLVAEIGGVSVLAARCEVRESTIMSWILGESLPSSDELYVLELIARRARVTFPPPPASMRPLPHASGVHSANRTVATRRDPVRDSGTSRMDELAVTFEAYRDWLKGRKTGEGGGE